MRGWHLHLVTPKRHKAFAFPYSTGHYCNTSESYMVPTSIWSALISKRGISFLLYRQFFVVLYCSLLLTLPLTIRKPVQGDVKPDFDEDAGNVAETRWPVNSRFLAKEERAIVPRLLSALIRPTDAPPSHVLPCAVQFRAHFRAEMAHDRNLFRSVFKVLQARFAHEDSCGCTTSGTPSNTRNFTKRQLQHIFPQAFASCFDERTSTPMGR